LSAWTGLAAGLVLLCCLFTPPAGAHPADPNLPINVNYIYGFNDRQPQNWVNQNLYVILWFGVLWLAAFLPAHLALRKIFAAPPSAAGRKSDCSSSLSNPARSATADSKWMVGKHPIAAERSSTHYGDGKRNTLPGQESPSR
jgi:hypothetical protein